MSIPEISVQKLNDKLQSKENFVVLDVREQWEIDLVSLEDQRLLVLPMSQVAQRGLNVLNDNLKDKEAEIYVLCHHGIRSAQVTHWLNLQDWKNVYSVQGGIDAFAREIDWSVGTY